MKSPGGPLLPLSPKAVLTHSQGKNKKQIKKHFQAFSGKPEGKTDPLSCIHMPLPNSHTRTHRFGVGLQGNFFPHLLSRDCLSFTLSFQTLSGGTAQPILPSRSVLPSAKPLEHRRMTSGPGRRERCVSLEQ